MEVSKKHSAPIPTKPGEHLWMAMAMFRVNPNTDAFLLDHENLLTIEGPGCWVCEQSWTPEVAARACPGEPEVAG